ncbi:MAG TPA: CotH kinase family protein [bacterium]|nr:CotH kinase family protein [bacterium]
MNLNRFLKTVSLLGVLSLIILSCIQFGCDDDDDARGDDASDDDTDSDDDDFYNPDDDSIDDDDDTGDDDTAEEVRINCGGPEISVDDVVYLADATFNPEQGYGSIGAGDAVEYPVSEMAGWYYAACGGFSSGDSRLGTMRRAVGTDGTIGYRFIVGDDLPRPLRLILAEPMAVLPESAPFDIAINGTVVLADVDLGAVDAVQHVAAIGVTARPVSGVVDVALSPKTGTLFPLTLAAIELLKPLNDQDDPVAAPDDLTMHEGIDAIALTWTTQETRRLAGYRVYKDDQCVTQPLLPFNDHGMIQFRDFDTVPGVTHTYWVEAIDLDGTTSSASASVSGASLSADILSLPLVELTIAADDLLTLALDPLTEEHVTGMFSFLDQDEDAEFHFRGYDNTRMFAKRSWKVHLATETYFSHDEVNLKSSWMDNSFLQEWSMDFVADQLLDIATYDIRHAAVILNDKFSGLYVDVEEADGAFLGLHDRNEAGCLLEAEFFFFDLPTNPQELNQKNGDGNCLDDIWDFTYTLHRLEGDELEMFLSQNVEMERYLQYRSANILLGNDDFLLHNYFLYQDPATARWEFIPKDNDYLWSAAVPVDLGTAENPEYGLVDYLLDQAFSLDSFRYAYAKQLLFLREDLNDLDLPAALTVQAQTLTDAVYGDFRKPEMTCSSELDYVSNACREQMDRINEDDYTQRMVDLAPTEFVGQILNELVADNQSVVMDENEEYEPYLEIHNLTGMPMFLRGLSISDDPGEPGKYPLPEVTIEPWDFALFFCDGDTKHGDGHLPEILNPAGGWIGLYEISAFGGQLIDEISYPALAADQAFGRENDRLADPLSIMSAPSPSDWNGGNATWHFPSIQDMRTDPHPPQALASINLIAYVTDEDGDLFTVDAFADDGQGWIHFNMFDDGAHGDGNAGDGIFGGTFPDTYEASALVHYYLRAQDAAGHSAFLPAGGANKPAFFQVGVPALIINELMADNETVWTDEYGEYEDWIEITVKDGYGPVDLSMFYLSDDPAEPLKWRLPDVQLNEDDYALIYADKDLEQGIWHAGFKLDKDGESIFLGVDTSLGYFQVDSFSYDLLGEDLSYARSPDKIGAWTLFEADDITPGAANPDP